MSEAAPNAAPTTDPVARYLLRNPAIAVTLAYLLLTTVGVTFSYIHYRSFGISIFDYWQPSDLVLAGFREPASFLYAAAMAAIGWDGYRQQRDAVSRLKVHAERYAAMPTSGMFGWWVRLNRRMVQDALDSAEGRAVPFNLGLFRRMSQATRANAGVTFVIIAFVLYLHVTFIHVWIRQYMVALWFPAVEVVVAADTPAFGAAEGQRQFLIGSSNGFLFLATEMGGKGADGSGREVTIVPISSVISFRTHEALSWDEVYGNPDR